MNRGNVIEVEDGTSPVRIGGFERLVDRSVLGAGSRRIVFDREIGISDDRVVPSCFELSLTEVAQN